MQSSWIRVSDQVDRLHRVGSSVKSRTAATSATVDSFWHTDEVAALSRPPWSALREVGCFSLPPRSFSRQASCVLSTSWNVGAASVRWEWEYRYWRFLPSLARTGQRYRFHQALSPRLAPHLSAKSRSIMNRLLVEPGAHAIQDRRNMLARCRTLLDPNLMRFAHIHSPPLSCRRRQIFRCQPFTQL